MPVSTDCSFEFLCVYIPCTTLSCERIESSVPSYPSADSRDFVFLKGKLQFANHDVKEDGRFFGCGCGKECRKIGGLLHR